MTEPFAGFSSNPLALAERLIGNLPGVVSARIMADPQGEISEIHVLTTPDRLPKQTVRDVESALLSGFNIRVDHKKISVAQLRGPLAEPAAGLRRTGPEVGPRPVGKIYPEVRPRLRLQKLEFIQTSELKCRAEVILAFESALFKGAAEDTATAANRLRLSARATLAALEEFLDQEYAFTLEGVRLLDDLPEQVLVVAIGVISQGLSRHFVGACYIHEDRNRAAVTATLDATNRFLTYL